MADADDGDNGCGRNNQANIQHWRVLLGVTRQARVHHVAGLTAVIFWKCASSSRAVYWNLPPPLVQNQVVNLRVRVPTP